VVLAGRTHNQYAIAAWLCWGNFNNFTYTIGIGFGNVVRTTCGNLLGQGKIWSAKNNAIYSIFMSFLLGLSITLFSWIFIDTIVDIYAPAPAVAAELKPLIQIFCLAITPDIMNGTLTTTMRLSGKVVLVMHIFFWVFSCSWAVLSFTGLTFGLSVRWMVSMYVLCDLLANGSMIYIIWKSQWEGLTEKEEKAKEMSLILS
jgi:Na+-driven multidrug efflux pump